MVILDFPTEKRITANKAPKPEDGFAAVWLDRYE